MKKLNTKGFAHWLIPALAFVIIGGIGSYMIKQSHAASGAAANPKYTLTINEAGGDGCFLAGRVWQSNQCLSGKVGSKTPACREPSVSEYQISPDGVGYCTKAVSTSIGKAACINTYHRLYIQNVGCARRIDQHTTAGAGQCLHAQDTSNPYKNYVVQSDTDKCVAASTAVKHAKVLVIGDSITAYYNRSSTAGYYGKGWWGYLVDSTGANFVTSAQGGSGYLRIGVKDGGHACSGTTFGERLKDVVSQKPDFIIIEGGRNDAEYCKGGVGGTPTSATASQTKTAVTNYLNAFAEQNTLPASKVYLITPWGPAGRSDRAVVVPIIKQAAQSHGFNYVDIPPFGDSDALSGGIHPNADGSKYIYDELTKLSDINEKIKAYH